MQKSGPIIIIEDDPDDQIVLKEVFAELGVKNELIVFDDPVAAYNFLLDSPKHHFLIICDVNLPKESGFQLKMKLDSNKYLREKSIPFVFFTTHAGPMDVKKAYEDFTVQGFFQKCATFDETKEIVQAMMLYWKHCNHPND